MGALQGPVFCASIAKKVGVENVIPRIGLWGCQWSYSGGIKLGGLWGSKGSYLGGIKVGDSSHWVRKGRCMTIQCSSISSSNENDYGFSAKEDFKEDDEEYVNTSIIDAFEVKREIDGFVIKMRDGGYLRCVYNIPRGLLVPDRTPYPSIVLKMEDGSDLLLRIFVSNLPSILLMNADRNVQISLAMVRRRTRPNLYKIIEEMIEKMGYAVKLVRINHKTNETQFAQLYLSKVGNETEIVSFDLQCSDAIHIAVRHRVPIQVHRSFIHSDGLKVIVSAKPSDFASDCFLSSELDRPDGKPCLETKEFGLVCNMLNASVEERYIDAARWRDELTQLRSNERNWVQQ